ncbi:MAG: hypothetical protein E7445_04205 [Ruminococcaceae bacterium]|nr:hypothetical protein [Oscillospiraceae bacterium]
MYRYSNGQISLSDFKQPVGMNLKAMAEWDTPNDKLAIIQQPLYRIPYSDIIVSLACWFFLCYTHLY